MEPVVCFFSYACACFFSYARSASPLLFFLRLRAGRAWVGPGWVGPSWVGRVFSSLVGLGRVVSNIYKYEVGLGILWIS